MKGKKWIAALMAAVLGVSMLAGCGTKEKTKIRILRSAVRTVDVKAEDAQD